MNDRQYLGRLSVMALLMFLLAGCMQPVAGGVFVWIDAPVEGLTVAPGTPVRIEGHATADSGITRIEVYVDGDLIGVIDSPTADRSLYHYEYAWTAGSPGDHAIQVVAASGDQLSGPDTVTVRVSGDGVSPTPVEVISVTPVEPTVPTVITISITPTLSTHTPTPTPTATPSLSPVPPTNTFTPVPPTHTFTPHPPTRTFTPTTPPPDTTGPGAPKPGGPSGDIGCVGSTTLSWNAPSDPSGIAEYRVELERSADNANWSVVGQYTGITATSYGVTSECGWYYRWRVMAIDGAGNPGSYSQWLTFAVPLT